MIFDSHCHLQFPQYDKDREEMLSRSKASGVSMICVGTSLKTSKQGIELAQKYDGIWATVGVHPNDIPDLPEARLLELSRSLASAEKVVAIGEVGLDYYRTPEPEKQKKQKEVFKQFVDLSAKYNKPLVLHFRDSPKGSSGRVHKDAIEILALSFKPKALSQTGVSHSFTGTKDEAKKYLELGFYLGFNGIITFARQYDEIVKYVPLENILLETDAPFLLPEPHRSRPPSFAQGFGGRGRNEPAYVIEVAKKVAELKNESLEKVIEQTTKNCKKLFKIV